MKVIETGLSPELLALLEASELPATDLRAGRSATFLAAVADGDLLGCIAYELGGESALLRSLAVQPTAQGQGVGRQLVVEVERHAKAAGGNVVFLLTTHAAMFFERLGYERVERDAAPKFIAESPQFAGLCPGSAALMMRRL